MGQIVAKALISHWRDALQDEERRRNHITRLIKEIVTDEEIMAPIRDNAAKIMSSGLQDISDSLYMFAVSFGLTAGWIMFLDFVRRNPPPEPRSPRLPRSLSRPPRYPNPRRLLFKDVDLEAYPCLEYWN